MPDGVDDLTAAALPLQGMTAHYLINSSFRVEPGHTVLTHAGAGGVGLLLTQLLKANGAHVSSPLFPPTTRKNSPAEAGADHVLRYEGFPHHVRELTDGKGVDVVYDGVGKEHLRRFPVLPAHPGHPGPVRRRLRCRSAGGPPAAQLPADR